MPALALARASDGACHHPCRPPVAEAPPSATNPTAAWPGPTSPVAPADCSRPHSRGAAPGRDGRPRPCPPLGLPSGPLRPGPRRAAPAALPLPLPLRSVRRAAASEHAQGFFSIIFWVAFCFGGAGVWEVQGPDTTRGRLAPPALRPTVRAGTSSPTHRTPGQIVHLRPRRSGVRREGGGGLGRGGVGRGPAPWGGPGRPAGPPPGPGRLAAARDPAGCNRRRGAAERCESPHRGPRPLPPPLDALRRRRGVRIAGGRCIRAAAA